MQSILRCCAASCHYPCGRNRPARAHPVTRVRTFLHIVLCLSPIGEAFRQRMRMFPSLVNCTTIDWFGEWPQEALDSVAHSYFADLELGVAQGCHDTVLQDVCNVCVHIHRSIGAASARCYEELRTHIHVTPTSYLELLSMVMRLLDEKRMQICKGKQRLEVGLEKLASTAVQVEQMQHELQELQPVLAATAANVEHMMAAIARDKEEAAQTQRIVQQQEREANDQAATAKAIAGVGNSMLANAPAFRARRAYL